MTRKKKSTLWIGVLLSVITFILGALSGFSVYSVATIESDKLIFAGSDLQIHFPELGNANAGDCIYIKAGDKDILIDAGSKSSSLQTITDYVDKFVEDKTLEYAIITHAHEDHYACYATGSWDSSLFSKYNIGTLITFAQSNNVGKNMYNKYINNLNLALSKTKDTKVEEHLTAKQCIEQNKSVINLTDDIKLTILDQKFYYELSEDENDHSVCVLITQGENNYLFTGDLEKEGEESLVERNPDLPKCVLYKAGHHGSKTSTSTKLLEKIADKGANKLNVIVTCVAGAIEYTANIANTFPTQEFINRVAEYTDKVYVTSMADYGSVIKKDSDNDGKLDNKDEMDDVMSFKSMNGIIVVYSDGGEVKFDFSNNDIKLKDTDWFPEWRKVPESWR